VVLGDLDLLQDVDKIVVVNLEHDFYSGVPEFLRV